MLTITPHIVFTTACVLLQRICGYMKQEAQSGSVLPYASHPVMVIVTHIQIFVKKISFPLCKTSKLIYFSFIIVEKYIALHRELDLAWSSLFGIPSIQEDRI